MSKSKLLVSGVALAALTLAGCSTETTSTPVAEGGGTSAPAATTNESGSGSSAFDSLKALSEAVSEKSASASSAHVVFTSDAGGAAITGEGDFSFAGADTAMQMTMDSPEGEITMRLIDNVIYVRMPQELQPGKPWLKVDLSGNNPMAEAMGGSLDQAKEADPRQMLEQLARSGSIESVEPEEIDGRQTMHYSIVVDTAKLKDQDLGMDTEAIAELEKAGIKTLPVEVWIDGDNLPVRFVTTVTSQGTEVKVQADYSDWGKPVDISAPPAAEVAELPGS